MDKPTPRDTADLIGETLRQALLDPDQVWLPHFRSNMRWELRVALKLIDVPQPLIEAIELLAWGDTKERKYAVGPWPKFEAARDAMLFEAGYPPHPKRPSTAKQTDVAREAGVNVRTIRRWQGLSDYRRLVALFREGKNRT